ncbi:MAG: hypothetical protein Aurels2KO_06740 [Aureliella sp.]
MQLRKSIAWLSGTALVVFASSVSFGQTGNTIQLSNAEVRLIHEIEVAAQADGIIREINVEEGAEVKADQLAVVIDSRVADAEVAVAKVELAAAEKQAEQTAEIDYAKATLAVAKQVHSEMQILRQRNSVSKSQLREAKLEETRGELGVDAQLVKKVQDQMAVEVAREKLHAAEVRRDIYKTLVPMEGVVVEKLRDRGEWVRAGEPVFKMVHLNELKVSAMVPVYTPRPVSTQVQPYAPNRQQQARQQATVSPSELKGAVMKITVQVSPTVPYTFESEIYYVSPTLRVDEVEVWAKLPNQRIGGGAWLLRDGMIADVQIILP